MVSSEISDTSGVRPSSAEIRQQLERLVNNHAFRTSKRSVQFLSYVVEKTLEGAEDQIKERTIGVEVFGRSPAYDTNADHVVRTAAIELRKRLAIYYGEQQHRSELRMTLVPGSYVPHFFPPDSSSPTDHEALASALPEATPESTAIKIAGGDTAKPHELTAGIPGRRHGNAIAVAIFVLSLIVILAVAAYKWNSIRSPQQLFWQPVLDSPGAVLLAVGDVPNGPPTLSTASGADVPIIHRTNSPAVPYSDAVTMARVAGILQSFGKKVIYRPDSGTSFSDLRESPVVLIGAFNNEWSLRMTRQLRYTLALDPDRHLIYIRDAKNDSSRSWSWQTDGSAEHHGELGRPPLQDYALISRIWNSQTGRVIIVIGGLYTYGTQAAGELLADAQIYQGLSKDLPLADPHRNLQIVLRTTVTDGVPGPPQILALSSD